MGWGGYLPPEVSDEVLLTRPRDHFCAACWCSAKTLANVPCWHCGGETTPTAPHNWIWLQTSGVNVRAGKAFDVVDIFEFLDPPAKAAWRASRSILADALTGT